MFSRGSNGRPPSRARGRWPLCSGSATSWCFPCSRARTSLCRPSARRLDRPMDFRALRRLQLFNRMLGIKKSPWIIHYDASSCNGCDIETLACLTPLFDVERLGIVNTGNPKHADIFVVTGAVNEQSRTVIRNIYEQMPEPKVVVAVGICASTGG